MVAEAGTFTLLVGLEVTDPRRYAEYRARMTPLLHALGGAFGLDLEVARVLKGPSDVAYRVNRVFSIEFPSRAVRDQFFADAAYRAVRSEWFEPAVGHVVSLGEWEGDGAVSGA